MQFPRDAFVAFWCLLVATLACAAVAHAFPSHSPAPRSESDQFSVSTLAQKARPKVAVLREALEQNPDQADVLVELGEELEQIGDLGRALAVYDDALRARPDHPRAFYAFWHARASQRARETDAAAAAREPFATAGQQDPSDSGVGGGRPLARRDPFAGSLDESRRFALANPEDAEARMQLGRALLGAGEVEAAIGQYRMALAGHPNDAAVRLHLAQALMLTRRWSQARAHLEQVVRLRPDLARAHYALGLVRYTLNDVPGSIEAYRDALLAHPGWAQAHFQLGLLLRLNGREEDGVGHLLEAARRGVPQAQYLVGAAYRSGQGVSPDLDQTVAWWFRAAGQGLPAAREGLARLRLAALRGPRAEALQAAFHSYRESFWAAYPELTRSRSDESVGVRLLQRGRARDALPILLQEAAALSGGAHRALETLYEVGVEGALEPYDARILAFFDETAREGVPRSMLVLGRIYFEGLGVAADPDRAGRLLLSGWSAGVAGPLAGAPLRVTWSERSPAWLAGAGTGPDDPRILR